MFPCSFVKSQTTVEIVLSVEEPCSQILHISLTLYNSWYAAAGGNMHAWHHLNWRKSLPVRGRQCCWIPLHHKSVPQWWKSEKLPLVDWREILDKLPGNFFLSWHWSRLARLWFLRWCSAVLCSAALPQHTGAIHARITDCLCSQRRFSATPDNQFLIVTAWKYRFSKYRYSFHRKPRPDGFRWHRGLLKIAVFLSSLQTPFCWVSFLSKAKS